MSGNILITGFGPFGEHLINASWESVKLLPDNMDGYKVIKQEISVSYQHVEEHIPELWKNLNPQVRISKLFINFKFIIFENVFVVSNTCWSLRCHIRNSNRNSSFFERIQKTRL